jgi:oligopeptidase B
VDAVLGHTAPLQETLFEEIRSRVLETDVSVPVRKDGWLYASRTTEGLQYATHTRTPCDDAGEPVGDESVVLDENALADEAGYFALGAFDVSPTHRRLLYSTDYDGDELYTLRVRDLETGTDLDDVIEGTYYGTAWCDDEDVFYYVLPDEAMRPYRVRRHRIGTSVADDEVVFEETDERFFVAVERSRSERFVFIASGSKTCDEWHLCDAADPAAVPTVVWPRRDEVEYGVDHGVSEGGDELWIVTNLDAPNGRLLRLSLAQLEERTTDPDDADVHPWTEEVLAHDPAVKIDSVDVFASHVVVEGRRDGLTWVQVRPRGDGAGDPFDVDFGEAASTIGVGQNAEFVTDTLQLVHTSFTSPRGTWDLHLPSRERVLRKRQPVLGDWDPERWATSREWATAPDGTRVPITLMHARDVDVDSDRSEPAPLMLYGYGAYEACIDPTFSSARLSLLERGMVFAIAHVRGGGEMGRHWYDDGKLLHKSNTFGDFVACAEHLVARGWTAPGRIAARGGSAGGLLMGAVLNARPDLWGAVVAEVPFVDVVTTMLDATLPLTVTEWEEWGNPAEEDSYRAMRAYCPYENVRAAAYPPVFISSGLHDPRVQYWEPAKWTAALQAANTADTAVLCKTEMGAGHGGPSGRYDAWRDEALVYAFVLDALGIA